MRKAYREIFNIFVLITAIVSSAAQGSTDFEIDKYHVYEITSDIAGIDDELYYLESRDKARTVILPFDDLIVPIFLKGSESFIVRSDGTVVIWTESISPSSLFLLDHSQLLGDFDGDGVADLLLKSNSASYESLIVFGDQSDTPAGASSFSQVEGYDVYDASLSSTDLNGDGRDDLTINFGNGTVVSALTQSGGTFNSTRGGAVSGSLVPGALAGDFSVGKEGAANYNIPLAVAPGGAGMHPSLSFTYSSGGGNGYMGMGWNFSRPASISRCSTTFIEDGYVEADKYWCLDGQKMVEVSAGTYMLANTNFSKIAKISGREAFQVYFKSGEIGYFGDYDGLNSHAHDTNSGTLHLAKMEDRAGNKREYTYQFNATTGEHYLGTISYPGGVVRFEYSAPSRLDRSVSWKDGNKSQILRTLNKVTSEVSGQTYRSYSIGFETGNNGQQLVSSITECGADGTCLASTNFDWSELDSSGLSMQIDTPLQLNDGWLNNPHFIDLNGDGFTDLFMASGNRFQIRLGNGDGTFQSKINSNIDNNRNMLAWKYSTPIDIDADGRTEVLIPERGQWRLLRYNSDGTFSLDTVGLPNFNNGHRITKAPVIADFDGNGLPDIMMEYKGSYTVLWESSIQNAYNSLRYVFLNHNGTNFSTCGTANVCGSNGTSSVNYADEYYEPAYKLNNPGINIQLRNIDNVRVVDIENDGKQEIMFAESGVWKLRRMDVNPSTGSVSFSTVSTGTPSYDASAARLVDLNGDGLLDLLYSRSSKWSFNINQGGAFGPSIISDSSYNDNSRTLDYDDDGKTDLIYIGSGAWQIKTFNPTDACFSSGTGCFTSQSTGFASQAYKSVYRTADFDGDGLTDVITQSDYKWKVFTRASGGLPTYLTSITNGYGLKTEFTYGQLFDNAANADFYEKGDDLEFPLRNMSGPMRVVKRVTLHKNDSGFTDIVDYKYKQLAFHLQGLGSLGFQETTSITPMSKTVAKFSRDWQNRVHGMPLEQTTYKRTSPQSSTWTEVTKSVYNNLSVVAVNEPNIRHTFVKSSTETARTLAGDLVKTTESTYTFDVEKGGFNTNSDFGNTTRVSVKTTSADAASPEVHEVVTDSYYEQENYNQWIVGKVTRSEVAHTATNRETVNRKSSWVYDSSGYLEQEIIEPASGSNNSFTKTTIYGYNGLGLRETATISIAHSSYSDRVVTTKYDALGRYPISVTNSVGTVYTYYDPVLGLATAQTDLNGNTATTQYDGFGRETLMTKAGGTFTKTTLHSMSPTSGIKAKYYNAWNVSESEMTLAAELPAEYYVRTVDQNGVWTQNYFDRLGKSFHTRQLNPLGQEVRTDVQFDKYGKVLRESEPYFSTDQNNPRYWATVAERDASHQPLRMLNQEGEESRIVYEGLKTTYTNEKNQQKTELKSVDGKLYQVMDHYGHVVQYEYNAAGDMVKMIDLVDQFSSLPANDSDISNNIETIITYDRLGRKTSMDDPNKGLWTYTYNAFGELVFQEDAEGNKTCQSYDDLGRMVKRIDSYAGSPEQALAQCANDESNTQTTHWYYDTAVNGAGKLARVEGPSGYIETYSYDSLGRPLNVNKTIAGEDYLTKTSYDAQSRPKDVTYPSGLKVVNVYNSLGALSEIRKADNQGYYWKLNALDNRGNVIDASMANGAMVNTKVFSDARGWLLSTETQTGLLSSPLFLQQNAATYDELGSVIYRENLITNSSEVAGYDHLNRLKTVDRVVNGVAQPREGMTYSYNGNIATKWNVAGSYQYAQACNGVKPGHNAVSQAGGNSYCYDRNGNMVSGADRTIQWNSFGKPSLITRGSSVSVAFEYGPDRSRIRRIDTNSNGQTTTVYLGSYEKVTKPNGVVDERHTIGGIVSVNIETTNNVKATTENYLLKDNLGSVVATVDPSQLSLVSGYIGEHTSFDAWGFRRGNDWSALSLTSVYAYKSSVTDRGFTGHEHIDEVGLIHMNGRVYDPVLGRFISADPFITDPEDLQSLNRYSYVRNNPLTVTDPTGYFDLFDDFFLPVFETLATGGYNLHFRATDKALREFGRFARKNDFVAEITQIAGCYFAGPACFLVTAAVTYAVTDGDFAAAAKAGAIAFVQAGVANGIGDAFAGGSLGGTDILGKTFATVLHGALGGVVSVAQGGDFKSGFASGAFSKAASFALQGAGLSLYEDGSEPGTFKDTSHFAIGSRTAIAAVIGGTASELSGGNFANGAVTAAMQHLFNAEGQGGRGRSKSAPGQGRPSEPFIKQLADALGVDYSWGTYAGGSLIGGGGLNGGMNGQYFSNGDAAAFAVAGTGWGWDIGGSAEANFALYFGDGTGGASSWSGLFYSGHVSAFGGTLSVFGGGGWVGVSVGPATDGVAVSFQLNEYIQVSGD